MLNKYVVCPCRRYVLRLPTTLPSACVPSGTPLAQVLDLQVSISSGVQGPVSTELPSHPHSVAASGPGHTQLVVSKDKPLKNCDLQLSYQVGKAVRGGCGRCA
jgi:hypothetical protein